jgi:lysophospholipid acyltransferase (LPLAT)-like uncharacterized protein
MTLKRQITYGLLSPLLKLMLYSLWASCRVKKIEGEQYFQKLHDEGKSFIPCFWHQHHIFCSWYMRKLIQNDMKIGFLISPSVDGEIPARMAQGWGAAEIIRGSKTRSGAQTLRDMYNVVVKRGISPVTTSDGPTGPIHKFKKGDLMLSQFTRAPLVPLSYAASDYWMLKTWDRFIIPKPFSRIIISIGEPVNVDKSLHMEDLPILAEQMEQTLLELYHHAHSQLDTSA